jgi:hypothetical protein
MEFWDELSLPWKVYMGMAWEAYCDDYSPIPGMCTFRPKFYMKLKFFLRQNWIEYPLRVC